MTDSYFKDAYRPRRSEIRDTIKKEHDGRVATRTGGGQKDVLHALDVGSEEPTTVCESQTDDGAWKDKPLAVFPYGFRDWCDRCLVRMFPERSTLKEAKQ